MNASNMTTQTEHSDVTRTDGLNPSTVLIVDDSENHRSMLRLFLETAGYRVKCAENGARGYEMARSLPPDLILLDVMMPVMDGHGMLEQLRADRRLAHIPVIMLTVESGGSDVLKAFDAGTNDYMKKPADIDELLARIRMWIGIVRHRYRLESKIQRLRDQNAFLTTEITRHFDAFAVPAGAGKSSPVKAAAPGNEAKIMARPGEHILIVDDDEAIVNMQKQILECFNYSITSRTSSLEALEDFRTQPDKYHLVITDMVMPEKTGDQLAKDLLAIRPDIPIILCTGWSESLTEKHARAIGIRSYLKKPVTRLDLARTIRKVLDGNESGKSAGMAT